MSKKNQTNDPQLTKQTQAKPSAQTESALETAVDNPLPSLQRAYADPRSLTAAAVKTLQRTMGNQALGQLIIQRKMTLGPVGDKYEQEADAVAKKVVSNLSTSSQPTAQCQEDDELQMMPITAVQRQSTKGGAISADIEQSIQNVRGTGQSLADNVRVPMENAFGTDFSGVNIHTNSQSNTLNQSLQARAFTTGQDIFFRQGEYSPSSSGGQELLAHELTHVVQQGGAVQRQEDEELQLKPETAVQHQSSEGGEISADSVLAPTFAAARQSTSDSLWDKDQQGGSAASSNIHPTAGLKSGVGEDKILRGLTFGKFNRPPPDAKWRVPSSANLEAILAAGTVDEAVVRSRVRRLLDRMSREGRLHSATSLTDIGVVVDEIFPAPGILDQAAYDRYIDPADRTMVYYSVREASTPPHAADRADLRNAMLSAAATAQSVATDEAGLQAVFGPAEWTTARDNYRLIHDRLTAVSADIENRITTDYNLDAQETFLGGWASFGGQHMHLLSEVVADPLTADSKATLLHEAAHLAASSIDDHVYYGTTGFEAAGHATKIDNAAHYEELPRRVWGTSRYSGQTFTPGVSSSGAPLTTEERIRAGGVEYYRRAWDAAADTDDLIKQARRDQLDGTALDGGTVARLLEVSPLMDLTLHEQRRSPPDITQLDVTTSESIVRAMSMAGDHVENLTNVMPMGPFLSTADEISAGVNLAVDAAMAAYGGLLGDATRDRQLMGWLHSHYRNVYP